LHDRAHRSIADYNATLFELDDARKYF